MDASLDNLKKDPTLTTPARPFPEGINRKPVKALPFLQRPGRETRINSVNKDEMVRALEKHGTLRKQSLQGPELNDAVKNLMADRGMPREQALKTAKSTPLTGGWDKPPVSKDKTKAKNGEDSPTKKLVFGRAKSLVSNINWDPQTRIRTEARGSEPPGRESYSDPDHNPQGKLITHESTSGRGVRYSSLDSDHVASSKNHDETLHVSTAGEDLRTVRGFTNPPPFSEQSV